MQEVKYTNPIGRSVTFSPKSKTHIFETIEGIGGIQTVAQTTEPFSLQGAIFYGTRAESREVTLRFHLKGKDLRESYQLREKCMEVLSPMTSKNGALGKLEYKNNAGKWWIPAMVLHAPETGYQRINTYLNQQVVFYCPDPFWRASEIVIERLGFLGGAFKFPLIIPDESEPHPGVIFGKRAYQIELFNAGNSPTPIKFTIRGPAVTPTLIHLELGTRIRVEHELSKSDQMIIDTTPGAKKVIIQFENGEKINAMQYLSYDSEFIQLKNGSNTIKYETGDDTLIGSVDIAYWPRFGGV